MIGGRTIIKIFLVLSAMAYTGASLAQDDGRSQKEQEKILAKQEKQKKKDAKEAEKELRKRHLDLQDKKTRKRIKQHDRRADKHGTGRHREPFLKRIFGSKQ